MRLEDFENEIFEILDRAALTLSADEYSELIECLKESGYFS